MPNRVTEAEVLAFLRAIESEAVSLVATHEPQEVYAGNVHYTASNGWTVTVFNDANQWDYLDELHTADGRWCDYDEISEHMPRVDGYRPSDEVAWSRYRIPGYLRFRCVRCGKLLDEKSPRQTHDFCCSGHEHPAG